MGAALSRLFLYCSLLLDFFCIFWCPKTHLSGRNFPEKKIFFFLRFFDFSTRRWPIQSALVVQKMAGE